MAALRPPWTGSGRKNNNYNNNNNNSNNNRNNNCAIDDNDDDDYGGDGGRSTHIPFAKMKANLLQPAMDHERQKELQRNYIPGHHIIGVNYQDFEVRSNMDVEKNAVDDLIRQFDSGEKNAISVLHEYCSLQKLTISSEERPVSLNPTAGRMGCFGNVFIIQGMEYPLGVGMTKKDAKADAAKEAFQIIRVNGYLKPQAEDAAKKDVEKGPLTNQNQDPVSQLTHFCQQKGWNLKFNISDEKTEQGYRCDGIINGTIEAVDFAITKKAAKKSTANKMLRLLFSNETNPTSITQMTKKPMTHFDKMTDLVMAKMNELTRKTNFVYTSLAGFVVKYDRDHDGEVVAIGTGNDCIQANCLDTNGRIIIDCHAEVMARRALLKWIYGEMRKIKFGGGANADCIFERPKTRGGKIRLKEQASLHMYISSCPCGDANKFQSKSPSMVSDEEWRSMDEAHHTPYVNGVCGKVSFKKEEWSTKIGNLFRVMSCSDKILKWNVLGIQGGLLSHFMEPLYVNSYTFGDKFNFGNLARALCCRLPDTINEKLPSRYQLRHPFIGRPSIYKALPLSTPYLNLSVNWCSPDADVEFVNPKTGIETEESPVKTSMNLLTCRLSKMGFVNRFKLLCKQFTFQLHPLVQIFERMNGMNINDDDDDAGGDGYSLDVDKKPYAVLKCDEGYNEAKNIFKEFLLANDLETWTATNSILNSFVKSS